MFLIPSSFQWIVRLRERVQQYNLHLFVMWAGDIFKVSYLSHFVLKYEYHLCNSVIRAFFNHYNPSKFCQIVTNFHNFFNLVQHKVLFHTTHFLFVTSLKIKACKSSHKQKGYTWLWNSRYNLWCNQVQ